MNEKMGYGLKDKITGRLVGYEVFSNVGGELCGETQTVLDPSSNQTWLVDDIDAAEYARCYSTSWYNADHNTPTHPNGWDPEEWVVVEVEMNTKVVEVTQLTYPQMVKLVYRDEPDHAEHLIKENEEHPIKPDFYLFRRAMRLNRGESEY